MPTERIVLEVDESGVATATSSANRQVAQLEVAFARAGQTVEQRLLAKIATLQQRMAGDPMRLKELDALQQRVLSKIAQNADKAGDRFAGIAAKIKEGIENPLQAAGIAAEALLTKLGPVGTGIAAMGAVAVAAGFAVFEMAKSLGEYGESLANAKMRTGLTTREVVQFGFAASLVGQDVTVFERGMRGLTEAMTDTSSAGVESRKWMHDHGVVLRELNGDVRQSGPILMALSKALSELPTLWERNEIGQKIFKRGWIESGPAILRLTDGVRIANEQGFFGPDEKQLAAWDAYDERIKIAEKKWDDFWRSMKAGAVGTAELLMKYGIPGIVGGLDTGGRSRPKVLSEHSLSAEREEREAQVLRAEGNSVLQRALARMNGDFEAVKEQVSEAQKKWQEAYRNLQTLSDVGADAARKEIEKVDSLRAAYMRLNEQLQRRMEIENAVKEFAKQTAPKLEFVPREINPRGYVWSSEFEQGLAKRSDKILETQGNYLQGTRTGMNGMPGWAMNQGPNGEWQPSAFEMRNLQAQMAGTLTRRNNPNLEEQDAARKRLLEFEANRFDERKAEDERHAGALEREQRLQEQLIRLRTGPGGEGRAIEQTYQMRLDYAQQIYDVERRTIGDTLAGYKLEQQQDEARIQRVTEIAELQRKHFDDLKSSMEGLIDAAWTKSKGFLDAVGNMAKAVLLAPIKEGLAAMMARAISPVLYGKDGTGGIMGRITGIFGGNTGGINNVRLINGAVPVVITGASAGSGSGGMASYAPAAAGLFGGLLASGGAAMARGGEVIGGGSSTAGLTQLASGLWQRGPSGSTDVFNLPMNRNWQQLVNTVGGPGGTSGFAGPVRSGAGTAVSSKWNAQSMQQMGGGLLMMGGAGLMLNGMRSDRASAAQTIGGGAMMGAGIGLMGGPIGAVGGAGIGLFLDAMHRGGKLGVAESTAGGAMLGFNLGGPIGAAIGAGVGFVAGIVRLFIKSAAEKVIEKVKTLYGLSIDKKTAQQIVQIANERYGKNLDMAVRAPETRELLRLYAQTMGQKGNAALMSDKVRAASLVESGGSLYQGPQYENGAAYTYASSLRTYQGVASEVLPTYGPGSGGMVNHISLDAEATVNLVSQGALRTLSAYPRKVAASALSGNRQSASRGGVATTTLYPSAILQ